ncbi:histidine phosphatase family protein [bacterium]|nr:histidine phosphatase family protein [bacterium]
MTDETKILVIRHGETQWNIEGRWQGHLDSPLTENGNRQAQAVANSLVELKFETLYSSDLGRALETAVYISKATGKTIIEDKRIRERGLGIFEGLTTTEMKKKYPQEFEAFMNFEKTDPDFAVEGAESIRQRFDRNVSFFNDIAGQHPGKTVVVVCHGGVVDSLFRYVIGIPLIIPRNYKIWNSGKSLFSCFNGKWQLQTFGDISHLSHLKTLDDV